jgi:hypothetical protein
MRRGCLGSWKRLREIIDLVYPHDKPPGTCLLEKLKTSNNKKLDPSWKWLDYDLFKING